VNNLLPAYTQFVPQRRLNTLLSAVSNIMPPLSEEDNVGLCVRLPILGTILCSYAEGGIGLEASLQDTANSLLPGLAEFALGSVYDSRARSAAASCMHAAITLVPPNKECPVRLLVTETISPVLSSASSISSVKNCLQILGLVVSSPFHRISTALKIISPIVCAT
jgi:hypothetical protein